MNDTMIPLTTAISVGSSLLGAMAIAIVFLFRRISEVEKSEKEDCADRMQEMERILRERFGDEDTVVKRISADNKRRAELDPVLKNYIESKPPPKT